MSLSLWRWQSNTQWAYGWCTAIARDSFEFKKRCQLFIGSNDESLPIVAVRICCEKHAIS
jgi:hypothetical protein